MNIRILILVIFLFSCEKNKSPISHDNDIIDPTPYVSPFAKQISFSEKDFYPKYSPNGEHISFLSLRNTYDPQHATVLFELWAMDTLRQATIEILAVNEIYNKNGRVSSRYSWCNDSYNLIIQVNRDNPSIHEIWKISLTGEETRISLDDEAAFNPVVSPDGSMIAYRSGNDQIIVTDIWRSNRVIISGRNVLDYTWTGDSKGLIYSNYDSVSTYYDLWNYKLQSENKIRLSFTNEREEDISTSSDGQYLAFCIDNELYITHTSSFQPQMIFSNARNPRWCVFRRKVATCSGEKCHPFRFIVATYSGLMLPPGY